MPKVKLDWFKLDCQLDDKMELIEAEFGLTGFAVVVKLFMKIYGGEGYYCEWNDDVALVFAKKNNVGARVVSEIVSAALRRGIFNEELYKKCGVLTSHGIQSRYFDCVGRRKFGGEKIKPEYLLIKCAQNSKNADISSKNVYISKENDYIFSQNRKEENRGEENRVEERRKRRAYGENGRVFLTDDEFSELVKMSSRPVVKKYIEKMDSWSFKNQKPIKNAFAEISNWIQKDGRLSNHGKGVSENKALSYDLDVWREISADFNPNDVGFEEE